MDEPGVAAGFHGVRYQVSDVSRAVAFYTGHLGFALQHQQLPAFANVSLGDLHLLLSGPGASGSRPMPDGRPQQPGGWNRIVLRIADLPACIDGSRRQASVSATTWKPARAAGRFSWTIRTAIPLNCSSRRSKR